MKYHSVGAETASHVSVTTDDIRIEGKRVLVTGAGGSIGSALVRTLIAHDPAGLTLLDCSESALFQLEQNISPLRVGVVCVLGDCGEEDVLASCFAEHRPEIVLHAAAFKHVPLLERNPFAAVRNNVLGTYALLQSAIEHGVEQFVQVSTDKAVDPGSIMGASKRIAELLVLNCAGGRTRMSAVRLGNVWASQGSVVELFLQQIEQGIALTVTHPEASRYFMTMDEAVTAILAALDDRSIGTILLPQLADPVRIVDLAHRLLREHSRDASIDLTSLRPGDKLTESLLSQRESFMDAEGRAGHLRAVASPSPSRSFLLAALASLRSATHKRDLDALLATVCALVPEYRPSSALLSLSDASRSRGESHA